MSSKTSFRSIKVYKYNFLDVKLTQFYDFDVILLKKVSILTKNWRFMYKISIFVIFDVFLAVTYPNFQNFLKIMLFSIFWHDFTSQKSLFTFIFLNKVLVIWGLLKAKIQKYTPESLINHHFDVHTNQGTFLSSFLLLCFKNSAN